MIRPVMGAGASPEDRVKPRRRRQRVAPGVSLPPPIEKSGFIVKNVKIEPIEHY